MKKILQIAFWVVGLFFCYMIYKSVTGPIEFNKVKTERYTAVISKLRDIREVQEAHRIVTGKYADNFDQLTAFVENGKFTLTSQRDTSWTEYDKTYKIEVVKQGVVVDTLGYVGIKDSLFKDSDRYKNLRYVDVTENPKQEFVMKSGSLDKNGYSASVFEVYVPKKDVLWGLDPNEITKEINTFSVEDVKGEHIKVGSLQELSTNGNWPTSYDAKAARK